LSHGLQGLFDHAANRGGGFIGQQVCDPNHATLVLSHREDLYRSIMVNKIVCSCGPRMSTRLVVNTDYQFTRNQSVRERHDPCAVFEFAIDHKPWDQTFVNRPDVADGMPNEPCASVNFNFFVNCGHSVSFDAFFKKPDVMFFKY
jgi:hypothetical protein